jgi:hypothetical protein
MARLVKMLSGVAVRRIVATADMPAGSAQAQMDLRANYLSSENHDTTEASH